MRKGLLFLFLLIVSVSCREDLESITTQEDPLNPPIIRIVGNVVGQITTKYGEAIAGAEVLIGGVSTLTDENGYYSFQGIDLDAAGSYLEIREDNFFHGSKRFYPKVGATNYVNIKLLFSFNAQQLNAEQGGEITDVFGTTINFSPNSIVDEAGNPYTGTVRVLTEWLDPSDLGLGEWMPGNLEGINQMGERVALGTYGMVAVELVSPNRAPLNLKDGAFAQISFPTLSASLSNSAPAEIPLWYFDEEQGIWIEEGMAQFENGRYVGLVSHFSFWNCDAPFPLINLEGSVVNADGHPIQNLSVRINANTLVGYGVTNTNGSFSGKVPKDQPLTMVFYNDCADPIYETEIGSFNQDIDLGEILVDDPELPEITITGQLFDCDGKTIENGLVKASIGNLNYFFVPGADGRFSNTIFSCSSDTIRISGINITTKEASDSLKLKPSPVINTGPITVCGNSLQTFISLNLDTIQKELFSSDLLHFVGTDTTLGGIVQESNSINGLIGHNGLTYNFQLLFKTLQVGTYNGGDEIRHTSVLIYEETPNGIINQPIYYQCPDLCESISLTITEVGEVGGLIKGSFSGNFQRRSRLDPALTVDNVPIEGTFSAIRSQ